MFGSSRFWFFGILGSILNGYALFQLIMFLLEKPISSLIQLLFGWYQWVVYVATWPQTMLLKLELSPVEKNFMLIMLLLAAAHFRVVDRENFRKTLFGQDERYWTAKLALFLFPAVWTIQLFMAQYLNFWWLNYVIYLFFAIYAGILIPAAWAAFDVFLRREEGTDEEWKVHALFGREIFFVVLSCVAFFALQSFS